MRRAQISSFFLHETPVYCLHQELLLFFMLEQSYIAGYTVVISFIDVSGEMLLLFSGSTP